VSKVEVVKARGHYLRGTVAEELASERPDFSGEAIQLLKFHGTYQQDDRDLRGTKGPDGRSLAKAFAMMVRTKLPGGKLTAEQLLVQLDLCDRYGNGTLRITDRQALQLHGVLKRNLRETIRRINEAQMTTLGACGDVQRNVLCCPAPIKDAVHEEIQRMADELSRHFLPRSAAYHEIWLRDPETGQRQRVWPEDAGEVEPVYGRTYLPRKFKTAIALPEDNCVDVYTNDLGLVAICRDGRVIGYNVLAGGGLGMTPSKASTFPALAREVAFVAPEEVVAVAEAVVKVQRDHGNRADRKRARLKYLIADWGVDRFRSVVAEYYGRPLTDPHPVHVCGHDDHMGWHPQGDGRWFYGLNIENGRLADHNGCQLKAAVRRVAERYRPGIRLTGHQSILFTDIAEEDRSGVEEVLRQHGVASSEEFSTVRRWSMACVALPTCPLAVTEAERVLPSVVDQLERELQRLGLAGERFTVRMTGCPNGCARPYNADIGLVGKTKGKYTIYLGGSRLGTRLAFLFKDLVPLGDIVSELVPVLQYFRQSRRGGETLGDFCARKGREDLLARSPARPVAAG